MYLGKLRNEHDRGVHMFMLGGLIGLVLYALAGLWYLDANSRFSKRILGYGLDGLPSGADFARTALPNTMKMLRASRTPLADPTAERERLLMVRRYRICIGLIFAFPALALIFELVGLVYPYFLRGGLIGLLILGTCLSIMAYRSVKVARLAYHYGSGASIRKRDLLISITGIFMIFAILLAMLAWSSR